MMIQGSHTANQNQHLAVCRQAT